MGDEMNSGSWKLWQESISFVFKPLLDSCTILPLQATPPNTHLELSPATKATEDSTELTHQKLIGLNPALSLLDLF